MKYSNFKKEIERNFLGNYIYSLKIDLYQNETVKQQFLRKNSEIFVYFLKI